MLEDFAFESNNKSNTRLPYFSTLQLDDSHLSLASLKDEYDPQAPVAPIGRNGTVAGEKQW
jgi:hypothetical protein